MVRAWWVVFFWAWGAGLAWAQGTPPDLVRLHDGSFLRGAIVESNAEHVVIQLATGEVRTVERSLVAEVRSSDDDDVAPVPAASRPLERAGSRVVVRLRDGVVLFGRVVAATGSALTLAVDDEETPRILPRRTIAAASETNEETEPDQPVLHVTADEAGVSLHRLSGTTRVAVQTGQVIGTMLRDDFAVLCNVPCGVEVPPGTYQLGVARGTGRAQRVGLPLTVARSMRLHVEIDSRELERVIGFLLLFGPGLGGFATTIAGAFVGVGECRGRAATCDPLAVGVPYFAVGGVVLAVALAVGIPLAALRDHVALRW